MRKWGGIAAVALLVLLVAAVVAVPLLSSRAARRQLEARHAAIRAAGYPADLAELDAWYEWPATTSGNAAAYVERAVHSLQQSMQDWKRLPLLGEGELPAPGEPFSPEQETGIATALEMNAEALPLFREAARLKQARYDAQLTEGYSAASPHTYFVSLGGQFLALDAAMRAERGDTDAAVEDIVSAVALADTLAQEPTGMAQTERIGIHLDSALPALARMLSRARLSDAQLVRLSEALGETELRDTFYRGIAGNRCMFEGLFDDPERALQFSGAYIPKRIERAAGLYGMLGLTEWDRLYHLDRMEAYLAAVRTPVDERADRLDAVERAAPEPPRYGLVSRYVFHTKDHPMGPYMMNSVRHVARLRCARAALAVERHRLAHGALPERLEELVPAYLESVPRDPFAKEPLRYLRKEPDYIVYSVGADRSDNGGFQRPLKRYVYSSDRKTDEIFEVQRHEPDPG